MMFMMCSFQKTRLDAIDLQLMKLPSDELEEVLSTALPAEEARETPRLSPSSCLVASKEEVLLLCLPPVISD